MHEKKRLFITAPKQDIRQILGNAQIKAKMFGLQKDFIGKAFSILWTLRIYQAGKNNHVLSQAKAYIGNAKENQPISRWKWKTEISAWNKKIRLSHQAMEEFCLQT